MLQSCPMFIPDFISFRFIFCPHPHTILTSHLWKDGVMTRFSLLNPCLLCVSIFLQSLFLSFPLFSFPFLVILAIQPPMTCERFFLLCHDLTKDHSVPEQPTAVLSKEGYRHGETTILSLPFSFLPLNLLSLVRLETHVMDARGGERA